MHTEISAELDRWRNALAKNIALRSADIAVLDLNIAVQKILNGIIFLRFCEVRGFEPDRQLLAASEGNEIARGLADLFYRAGRRYGPEIFPSDTESAIHAVDDAVLREILVHLYPPAAPFDLCSVPVDAIARAFLLFLGKTIRLEDGRRAVIQEQHDVQKAGGVHLIPGDIVRYAVGSAIKSTTGGRTPWESPALHIIDPACGSGVFLICAYRTLLSWHLSWYQDILIPLVDGGMPPDSLDVQALVPPGSVTTGARRDQLPVYRTPGTGWQLTLQEKRRILTECIYGLDVDQRAVEVTVLLLSLTMLDREPPEAVCSWAERTEEPLLPMLASNIKSGNALIGTDLYEDVRTRYFDLRQRQRVNASNWHEAYPEVLSTGGFDVVVGSPPRVREWQRKVEREYLQTHYEVYPETSAYFPYFIEKGIDLLRPGGTLCYILPNTWMRSKFGKRLRRWLLSRQIEEVIDFGLLPDCDLSILRISNTASTHSFLVSKVSTYPLYPLDEYVSTHHHQVDPITLSSGGWSLEDRRSADLLLKLERVGTRLGEYVLGQISLGISLQGRERCILDEATGRQLIASDPHNSEVIFPIIRGRAIRRYEPPDLRREYLVVISQSTDIRKYPVISEHLTRVLGAGTGGTRTKKPSKGGAIPCSASDVRNAAEYCERFGQQKIILPAQSREVSATLDGTGGYTDDATIIIPSNSLYLLGILNSKVARFFLSSRSPARALSPRLIAQFPIYTPDFYDAVDEARHTALSACVEEILALHRRLCWAETEEEKGKLLGQIEALNVQIDCIVYEIYDITEEEKEILEAAIAEAWEVPGAHG